MLTRKIDLEQYEEMQDAIEEQEGMKGIMRHKTWDDDGDSKSNKRSKQLSRGRAWDYTTED